MADDMDQIVDNLKQPSSWIRVLFMIGFAVLLYVIVAPVIFVLMLVQALFVLLTGTYNENLKYLGGALAQYVAQILLFISYNSELRPFPFSDFPALDPEAPDAEVGDTAESSPAQRKKASRKKATTHKAKGTGTATASDAEPE